MRLTDAQRRVLAVAATLTLRGLRDDPYADRESLKGTRLDLAYVALRALEPEAFASIVEAIHGRIMQSRMTEDDQELCRLLDGLPFSLPRSDVKVYERAMRNIASWEGLDRISSLSRAAPIVARLMTPVTIVDRGAETVRLPSTIPAPPPPGCTTDGSVASRSILPGTLGPIEIGERQSEPGACSIRGVDRGGDRDRVWSEYQGRAAHGLTSIEIGSSAAIGGIRVDRMRADCYRIDGSNVVDDLPSASRIIADRLLARWGSAPMPPSPCPWPPMPVAAVTGPGGGAFVVDLTCGECHGSGVIGGRFKADGEAQECEACKSMGYRLTGDAILTLYLRVRVRPRSLTPRSGEPQAVTVIRNAMRARGEASVSMTHVRHLASPAVIAGSVVSGELVAEIDPWVDDYLDERATQFETEQRLRDD